MLMTTKARVEVEDPKKGVFALGGSKYRKPCCHFYEQRRLSDEPAEPDASKSNERIHLTVRTLLEKKAVAPCKPLHNIPISQDENKKVVWKFPKTARSAEYTVKEDEMSKFELDLLKNWLQIEEAHPDSEKVDNMISGLLIDVEEELERQRRAVIDWIAPSQSPTHYGHLDHHVKGTNDEWFFHNNKFQDWVDGDGKTISCVGGSKIAL
jgi:hypothetical protein